MTKKPLLAPISVGLIATGDELTQGDILNTNGQEIVLALNALGLITTEHLIVSDEEERIRSAIIYFQGRHNVIILTGGLGPTSDDRTRYALAEALGLKLYVEETAWQALQARLARLNLPVISEHREQARIPEGGEILPNAAGTAAGCYLQDHDIEFFMLPGPPSECLPMFRNYVLPKLARHQRDTHQFKWLLLGANEGEIAAKLDTALKGLVCRTGYRWHYPYLDYKVFATSAADLTTAQERSLPIVGEYLVSQQQTKAEDLLTHFLIERQLTVGFVNNPLTQLIKHHLLNKTTHQLFSHAEPQMTIELSGFPEYWIECKLPCISEVNLTLTTVDKKITKTITFYYRDAVVIDYLAAMVAKEILAFYA